MSEESLRRLGELDFGDEPPPGNEHPLETADRIIDRLEDFLRAERISNTDPKGRERLDRGIADTTHALQFMRELRAKLEKQPSPTSDAEMGGQREHSFSAATASCVAHVATKLRETTSTPVLRDYPIITEHLTGLATLLDQAVARLMGK
ncbi:MAG: hypothetical protein Q7T01_02525, partial [bacterium]|nr:hypothetical protein [bacterium]